MSGPSSLGWSADLYSPRLVRGGSAMGLSLPPSSVVVCRRCGASVVLDVEVYEFIDPIGVHNAWHDRLGA